ncbi:MAG: response regulator [Candidatus Omnitrophota bacterium]
MKKKVLVVDDEIDILKIVAFRLEKAGYKVLKAVDGNEALNVIEKERPNLILLDLRLPLIDGYEVRRRLLRNEELKKIPIILITASILKPIEEKIEEMQVQDYVIKPFEMEDLLSKVEKYIS